MSNIEIVQHLSDGMTVKEIAALENMNRRTLEAKIKVLKERSLSKTTTHLVSNYFRKQMIT